MMYQDEVEFIELDWFLVIGSSSSVRSHPHTPTQPKIGSGDWVKFRTFADMTHPLEQPAL